MMAIWDWTCTHNKPDYRKNQENLDIKKFAVIIPTSEPFDALQCYQCYKDKRVITFQH